MLTPAAGCSRRLHWFYEMKESSNEAGGRVSDLGRRKRAAGSSGKALKTGRMEAVEKGKQKTGFGAKVAAFFELPSEVVLNLPRLVLSGDQQLLVENHQGLKVYTGTEIWLQTSVGALKITGEELAIKLITQDQVEIAGRIRTIAWAEEGEETP